MISFLICITVLILGYFLYGRYVERVFAPDDRPTPAVSMKDGADYVEMSTGRIFLIQLLNIAGLGPIYGAILGALWGPAVFIWITLGTIFAGAVHDYFIGMMSTRHKGVSIAELVGMYLGNGAKIIMRIFSVVLLVLVGTVFATGPAGLLAILTPNTFSLGFWVIVIIGYYFFATMVPVDKLIGRIYPIFGICLIFMALGVIGGIFLQGYKIPEITLSNLHPQGEAIWPFMFITVACGAISGFHATQSPLMARCISKETEGKKIFYGAMVAEGVIALIWAAAGVAFYETTGGLAVALKELGGQSGVVYDICRGLLGPVGAVFAMIGVVACPISSGDTAFRSARLVIADWFHLEQRQVSHRLFIAVPLLTVGYLLCQLDVTVVWRYFSWSNQTLAMLALWTISAYLVKEGKAPWLTVIPAIFMSAVTSTYILTAPEGLRLSYSLSCVLGIIFTLICILLFAYSVVRQKNKHKTGS